MSPSAPPPHLSLFCPVKNDWSLVNACLQSCRTALRGVSHEILLLDDQSNEEEQKKIPQILARFPSARLVEPGGARGIEAAVLCLIDSARGFLLAPLSADMRFCSNLWIPMVLVLFRLFRRLNLVFGKTRLVDLQSSRTLGVVGWSPHRGSIPAERGRAGVCDGTIRVAGGSVVYRREWFVQSGGFKPSAGLGPKSDFYLNHLAVLQGSSWHLKQVAAVLLEGRPSYTRKFSAEQYLAFCKKVVNEWEKEGIRLSASQRALYLKTEMAECQKAFAR